MKQEHGVAKISRARIENLLYRNDSRARDPTNLGNLLSKKHKRRGRGNPCTSKKKKKELVEELVEKVELKFYIYIYIYVRDKIREANVKIETEKER